MESTEAEEVEGAEGEGEGEGVAGVLVAEGTVKLGKMTD